MQPINTRFHEEVFKPYVDLLRSGHRIHPTFSSAKQMWEAKLTPDELVNGPYLERAQTYESGLPLESLQLHQTSRSSIKKLLGERRLWKHQTDALQMLLNGNNVVIATGTSSGKTLCYQIPILDDLVRDSSPGLRAIIIYPLNALVNDQLSEWELILADHPGIRFARFTGQTPDDQQAYQQTLKQRFRDELLDRGYTQQELQQEVNRKLSAHLAADIPNRLNHRQAIRSNPPHVLITNFSMLEYLLERPIDAPIFENARLKFLVLDEVHAYRGVQATEIAFLVRRLKERLQTERLVCIATSATIGKSGDPASTDRVRRFASDLFSENFVEPNPIYGTLAAPELLKPSFTASPVQYIQAAELLRAGKSSLVAGVFGNPNSGERVASLLLRDESLFRLRKDVLTRPILLNDAADALWPTDPKRQEGLQALLDIVALASPTGSSEDLLPSRLHYFVKAQDGLHICLRGDCPARAHGTPAYYVSRRNSPNVPEGYCPDCHSVGRKSTLVEVVACRKCGYLYGALQDLGPRRAQNLDNDGTDTPHFDSFSTELGWVGDSFWTYFSVEGDLPYPRVTAVEDEGDHSDLFSNPSKIRWCAQCGKKQDAGAGDNCKCPKPHLVTIGVFHRQCPHVRRSKDQGYGNLFRQDKELLTRCPCCNARNSSGIEPLHRFQESDDEMGLAMAIPLAHFQVTPIVGTGYAPRKLLCFTDHRQRAAAFPSLLEEETFGYDFGRKIILILEREKRPVDLCHLGELMAQEEDNDPHFFLPVSRFPEGDVDAKTRRNLWLAETFAYFGIPDSARESVEDLGLATVRYKLKDAQQVEFHRLIPQLTPEECDALLQTLLTIMRQRKAFTLPKGRVSPNDPAFGRVTADISYMLKRSQGGQSTEGWLPHDKGGQTVRENVITDYICRALTYSSAQARTLAEILWNFLTISSLLIQDRHGWKLDHQLLYVGPAGARYSCSRCGIVTGYSLRGCCPKKGCIGQLKAEPFDPKTANIIASWVYGRGNIQFFTLRSEEHTAQISKELAKSIEDQFKDERVNLLSSTTTFEMGINIGDLQKVLLRNAPPSSANYVQRVGRAGRGKDKNSVCVTLCRRTKYDADAWDDPPRLMSGVVHTPTVFLSNSIIAQRHFNAVLFAKYLRECVVARVPSAELRQQIRLEGFLTTNSRAGIPADWLQVRPTDTYFDYLQWLEEQRQDSLFRTDAGQSLLHAVHEFESGKRVASRLYLHIMDNIAEELTALMNERKKLFERGAKISDIEDAVKNLLKSDVISVLAKRGYLPRYAFPLDVVTLETGRTRWSSDADVELGRDRGIAVAEFAPGAQVIAHKKVFASEGLYIVSKTDRPEPKYYSECPSCKQIRTAAIQDKLLGPCTVCGKSLTQQFIKRYIEPTAFSVAISDKSGPERYRRSTLVRQRQTITHFIDHVEETAFTEVGDFRLALKDGGTLFRYNLGPDNKGFMLCPDCGRSESLRSYVPGKRHQRLRPFAGTKECANDTPWTKALAFAHEFHSYCLVARPMRPVTSVESLAYALQRGVCASLDLESQDIGVSWRWLSNAKSKANVEIVLYDNTPGGAGFVKEAYEGWSKVTDAALNICTSCTCEYACYDCLKSYMNQAYHEKLNRTSVLNALNEQPF